MQSQYLKTLVRIKVHRGALRDGSQQQKSQRALEHLSFLLGEFNTENEFLTRQVKELLHENRILKKASRERQISEVGRVLPTSLYSKARQNERREPYSKKIVFDSKPYSPYRTIHKISPSQAAQNQHNNTSFSMDRIVTPSPSYIPRTHERVPEFAPSIEPSATRIQPTIEQSAIVVEPILNDSRSSRRLSSEKKGIEVTSKSKSPESRLKRSTSRSNGKDNQIDLISPRRSSNQASVQITSNIHHLPPAPKARLVTQNIKVTVEPTKPSVQASQSQAQLKIPLSERRDLIKVKQPQPTSAIRQEKIPSYQRPVQTERQSYLTRTFSNQKYTMLNDNIPTRFVENNTVVGQQNNTDNPRRPRILDARDQSMHDRRSGQSTQRKKYISLIVKDMRNSKS